MSIHDDAIQAARTQDLETDDLDGVLDGLEQEIEVVPQAHQDQVLQLFHDRKDKPTEAQILEWKDQYGQNNIQVFAGARDQVYVFTNVSGRQWDKIQSLNDKLSEASARKVRDAVLKSCILWPKVDDQWIGSAHAGLPDSLFTVIMLNSYFLSPQQAMALTTML